MPNRERFSGTQTSNPTEAWYGTLLHELTHWSGAPHRLARQLSTRFGDDAYAAEELIAELGAAFLSADLGITSEPRPDHAAYLASWLKILKADKKAVFAAASAASKAADYLAGFSGEQERRIAALLVLFLPLHLGRLRRKACLHELRAYCAAGSSLDAPRSRHPQKIAARRAEHPQLAAGRSASAAGRLRPCRLEYGDRIKPSLIRSFTHLTAPNRARQHTISHRR